ncbi:MAG TPA: ATP synthase F0 subunit B [Candidatus Angelobacter sp.]|nr:ATP synthase F0 subunit B [Candidatus Angelobacter sp.]
MDEILRQVGQLLISAIPTMLGLLVVWAGYRFIVHGKLQQVLEQRHALTEGAIQRAQQEIAAAEARTAEYEQRIRDARAQVYQTQQANRQRMVEQRNTALTEARKQAGEMVKSARAALEKDVVAARATLEQQAGVLADKVIESVLRPAAAAGGR